MHFDLTEEQQLIADTARKLAEDKIAPLAEALDRGEGRAEFLGNLNLLAENGFMGLNVRAEYGGTEAGTVAFALAIEALARACASTAVTCSVSNMVGEVIQAVGSDAQRAAYLPKLCDGTYPAGGFCLTEAGAGSDPAGMRARAVTDPQAPKGKGISCFLVEAGTPGLVIGKAEKKMGQTGSATNEVLFQDCRVPAGALMGSENGGFRTAVGELAGGRIGVASLALGIARAAMDAAKAYARERQQFGQSLADMQGIQWMIADRETELEAARLLILQAAWAKDQGRPFGKEASMAKLFASEAAQKATYTALQIHGGAGYIKDYPLERHTRDARITTIYEGTSEIQRLIIAREVLKSI